MADAAEDISAGRLFNVTGIVAVITGGGTGIGRMFAKAVARNGAKAVYIIGRRKEPLEQTAAMGPPGVIIPLVGDVTSKDSLSAAVARVKAEQGYINVLVANSGINGPAYGARLPMDQAQKPSVVEFADAMWEPSMEDFTHTFHVNVSAVFYSAIAFLKLLDAGNARGNVAQKSQVIIVTSGAAANRKVTAGFAYSTSKAAAHHLAMMLATYCLPYQIRVNCVAPGIYPSEMTLHRLPKDDKLPWEEGALGAEHVPMMRTGSEADMAGVALYLISSAGAYVNGASVLSDGGRLSM